MKKALGSRQSKITIVDSDFKSYRAFADLSQTVLSRWTTVAALLRPENVLGLGHILSKNGSSSH